MPPIYFLIIDLFNEPRYPVNTSINKYILLCFYIIYFLCFGLAGRRIVRPRRVSFGFHSISVLFRFFPLLFCITTGCILKHQNLDGVQSFPIGFLGSYLA